MAAPTLVQHNSAQAATGANPALAYTSNISAAGNLLVAAICAGTLRTVNSISDTRGNTWTQAVTGGTVIRDIWWAIANGTGANTVTFALSGSATCDIGLYEFNHASGWVASPVDQTGAGSGTLQSHPCSTPGVTTTQAEEAGVTISALGSAFVGAAASGWTEGSESTRGYHQYGLFNATLSTDTAAWSSAPSNENTASVLATFMVAAGGATFQPAWAVNTTVTIQPQL